MDSDSRDKLFKKYIKTKKTAIKQKIEDDFFRGKLGSKSTPSKKQKKNLYKSNPEYYTEMMTILGQNEDYKRLCGNLQQEDFKEDFEKYLLRHQIIIIRSALRGVKLNKDNVFDILSPYTDDYIRNCNAGANFTFGKALNTKENVRAFFDGIRMHVFTISSFKKYFNEIGVFSDDAAYKALLEYVVGLERIKMLLPYEDVDENISYICADGGCRSVLRTVRLRGFAECASQIARDYPDNRLQGLLGENPYFSGYIHKITDFLDKEERIRKNILDTIPQNYIDFYPRARELKRHFILHVGPTNSGKTYEAIYAMVQAESGVYLGPLRLLAFEQYEAINAMGVPCSLVTGEEIREMPGSFHISSTIEMANLSEDYEVAVIDEAQMISDRSRGGAWTRAILGICAKDIHVCLAPMARELVTKIIRSCGDEVEVIEHTRNTPLLPDRNMFRFPDDVKKGDALIVFSRRDVHSIASVLQEEHIRCSVIYGALPYDVRHEEARRFSEGETDVLVATDAVGMGLNLPIRRIVFMETEKFDGFRKRNLYPEELRQIAGRAGRLGIFDEGYYTGDGGVGNLDNLINTPSRPLRVAHIDFPEGLLGIDVPLSELYFKWAGIKTGPGYELVSVDRERKLALTLEKLGGLEKEVIYHFVTLPFDEGNGEVYGDWLKYARCERDGEEPLIRIPFLKGPLISEAQLNEAEVNYKRYDLAYQYCRVFGHDEYMDYIMNEKEKLSELIIHYLSTHDLEGRKCKICGRKLEWNYRFRICDECYSMEPYRE